MTPAPKQTRGFTLVEIAVVLVLVALLASAVVVSSRGMLSGATREEVIARIGSLDAEARGIAKRLGRAVELHIDSDGQRLVLKDPQQPSSPPLSGYTMPTGTGFGDTWQMSRGEPIERDDLIVRYEPDGSSTTWGVSLRSQGVERQEASEVVVLGMTGQMNVWESDGQARDILAAALRRDTD